MSSSTAAADPAPWQRLGPGRIWVDYGPTQMLVKAYRKGEPDDAAAVAGAEAGLAALNAVAALRSVVRRPWTEIDAVVPGLPAPAKAMVLAARASGDPTLTPMAAVAGSIADAAADAIISAGADRAMANNGGDIALRLAPGEQISIGLLPDAAGRVTMRLTLPAAAGAGGVCTSGLGGRSHTRGIATAVTVLAPSAALADAAATLVGNATFVDHPAVEQVLARSIDPLTDIPDLSVTQRVGPLPTEVVERALEQARQAIVGLASRGVILGAVVEVAGRRLACLPQTVTLTEEDARG